MQWTLDQVREHPLWRGLTKKERRFFELLAENNLDDEAAAAGAFELQPQSVQVRLNQIRGAQDTGFLYAAMMGFALPSREELGAALWQLASKTRDEARKERCLRASAKVLGYERGGKAPAEGAPSAEKSGPGPDLSDFEDC